MRSDRLHQPPCADAVEYLQPGRAVHDCPVHEPVDLNECIFHSEAPHIDLGHRDIGHVHLDRPFVRGNDPRAGARRALLVEGALSPSNCAPLIRRDPPAYPLYVILSYAHPHIADNDLRHPLLSVHIGNIALFSDSPYPDIVPDRDLGLHRGNPSGNDPPSHLGHLFPGLSQRLPVLCG